MVQVELTNLRNDKGQVLVCMTSVPKAFPDCRKDKSSVQMAVPAKRPQFTVPAPTVGTYAIAVVHDENSNDKMDMALMLPREGFGFSRNPALRMGPPPFRDAAFDVEEAQRKSIRMRYML